MSEFLQTKARKPLTFDRNTSIKQVAQIRALVIALLNNSKEPLTKLEMRTALLSQIKEIVGPAGEEAIPIQFDNIIARLSTQGLIKRGEANGVIVFSANPKAIPDPTVTKHADESDEAFVNRRIGQQIRQLRKRREKGDALSESEAKLLQDYEQGNKVEPLETQPAPRKHRKREVAVVPPSPQPQANGVSHSFAFNNPAFETQPHQQSIAVQVLTPGGSVLHMGAGSQDQLDAILGSIKRHGF